MGANTLSDSSRWKEAMSAAPRMRFTRAGTSICTFRTYTSSSDPTKLSCVARKRQGPLGEFAVVGSGQKLHWRHPEEVLGT
jgi:hypothetical protein